ncbi:hypothetical protein HPB49_025914 [Dermacentor silvarum]|nr:hypothetical protein HPB49_025914 [Dermacentor silvarum]
MPVPKSHPPCWLQTASDLGEFNAANRTWGYAYDTPKGNELRQNANDMNFTLITDKTFPTRTGTCPQKDTTPDLCFVKNIADARWSNLA